MISFLIYEWLRLKCILLLDNECPLYSGRDVKKWMKVVPEESRESGDQASSFLDENNPK